MALLLRSLFRDPLVSRPLSRALRRFDDDLWVDQWPAKRARRALAPEWDSPAVLVEDLNRNMTVAMNRMQEFAEDLEALDAIAGRLVERDNNRPRKVKARREDMALKRTEDGGIQLALDVNDFKPEDLKIKLVDDNLVVEASSESSGKDSYRRSHFKRWFKLPEGCKTDEIKSKLTEDNRLLIDLPTEQPLEDKARTIPIEMAKPQQKGIEQETKTQSVNSSQPENN